MLLLQLAEIGPDYPRCFLHVASQPDWQASLPEGTPIATQELLSTLAAAEGHFPGLPARILAAIERGGPITEEVVYPKGRPESERTWFSRNGRVIDWALDDVFRLSDY